MGDNNMLFAQIGLVFPGGLTPTWAYGTQLSLVAGKAKWLSAPMPENNLTQNKLRRVAWTSVFGSSEIYLAFSAKTAEQPNCASSLLGKQIKNAPGTVCTLMCRNQNWCQKHVQAGRA